MIEQIKLKLLAVPAQPLTIYEAQWLLSELEKALKNNAR
jgi:hypothetical protein